MKFIRCLSILLLLSLLLTACTPSATPPDGEGPDGETFPPDAEQFLILAYGAASDYTMVRGDDAPAAVKSSFAGLRTDIQTASGVSLAMTTDYDTPTAEGALEILVGQTTRPATQSVMAALEAYAAAQGLVGDTIAICVVEDTLVILGTSDAATVRAVEYFTEKYMKVSGTAVTVARDTEVMMSVTELDLKDETVQGSPLKKQYSDYVTDYEETQLLSFDTLDYDGAGLLPEAGTFSIDERYGREGDGALRFVMGDHDKELTRVMWYNGASFEFSVADRHKSTLKLWLFVDDPDNFASDHDAGYGRQAGQATFYFRVFDAEGRVFCWNHTLTGSGWHEVELTFNIHNGMSEGFDFEHIVGFGLLVAAEAGAIIELDDLRGVTYETDYVPETLSNGDRLICDGEYNALDGLVVQEWYGCSYDLEDKMFGNSSIQCQGNTSVNDFRAIVANLDIPMSYQNDVLVFWMKVDKLSEISSLFIELNEDQDVHEYEYTTITVAKLQEYGLSTKNGEWSEIRIPLTDFAQNFNAELYGEGEDITLRGARFVITGVNGKTYTVHYDRIYLTTKDALGMN